MAGLTLPLPGSLRSFVEEQAAERGHATGGDYVRELIQKEHDRQRLRGLLLEGLESPVSGVADEAFFQDLRRDIERGTA